MHICLRIAPKRSVGDVVGKLKGKGAIILHGRHPEWRRVTGRDQTLWARGHCVGAVGLNESAVGTMLDEGRAFAGIVRHLGGPTSALSREVAANRDFVKAGSPDDPSDPQGYARLTAPPGVCNLMRPDQKGSREKNRAELRRTLPEGSSPSFPPTCRWRARTPTPTPPLPGGPAPGRAAARAGADRPRQACQGARRRWGRRGGAP